MDSKTSELEPKTFSSEQLKQALWDWDDTMHRALLQGKYVLLGETAKAAVEDKHLLVAPLEVGIFKRYMTPEVTSLFTEAALRDIAVPIKVLEMDDHHIDILYRDVPVKVTIIHKTFEFFKYPNQVIYAYEDFQVANPFENYWLNKEAVT